MKIVNDCKNPPSRMLWQITRSLSWIFRGDLEGLDSITLIDELYPVKERSPAWYRKARKHNHIIGGWYNAESVIAASITLNIRDIYRCIPKRYYWTPVATLIITHTLAHEVGHHVSSQQGYVFSPTEKLTRRTDEDGERIANRYASGVVSRMRKHWYYRAAAWAVNDMARWHYVCGVMTWKKERYQEAAEHWYKAAVLDPDNLEAANWYWRAKDKCDWIDGQ